MSGLVAKLLAGEPIPVAVVADQQDLKKEADAQGMDMACQDCGKLPCECNRSDTPRGMRRMLMDQLDG